MKPDLTLADLLQGNVHLANNAPVSRYGDVQWLRHPQRNEIAPVPWDRPTPPPGPPPPGGWIPWQSPTELLGQGWTHYPPPLPENIPDDVMRELLRDKHGR